MTVILARQVIKPECLDAYHKLAAELVAASRKETGCGGYESVQSLDDPRVHTFIEHWNDQEAMDIHSASEHFTRIVPQFSAMFDEAEIVTKYQVLDA